MHMKLRQPLNDAYFHRYTYDVNMWIFSRVKTFHNLTSKSRLLTQLTLHIHNVNEVHKTLDLLSNQYQTTFPQQILIPKWDYVMYTTLAWCQRSKSLFYDIVKYKVY